MPRTPAPLTVEGPGLRARAWPDSWWRCFDAEGRLLALFSQEADARAFVALPALIASLKEMREAGCAAMRVVADLDGHPMLRAETREQRFVDELKAVGVTDGFGVRADKLLAALAQADGPKEQP